MENNLTIVIEYESLGKQFNIYEPTTDTLLVSENLTEGLVLLNDFLMKNNLIEKDILKTDSIKYQLDSSTMKAMIDSNVKLIKKLSRGPSDFQISKDKFGSSPLATATKSFSSNLSQSQGNSSKLKSNINKVLEEESRFNSYKSSFIGGSKFGKGFKKSKFK